MSIKYQELKEDKGVELKIDSLPQTENEIEKAIRDIYDKFATTIREAKDKALEKGIQANTIVLNSNFEYLREFYYSINRDIYKVKPMILGYKLMLGRLPTKYEFAMAELETPDYEELIRKYVRVVNGQLVFKNISSKKNIKDFERLRGLVESE